MPNKLLSDDRQSAVFIREEMIMETLAAGKQASCVSLPRRKLFSRR